jgi:flagellar export protein FliJ
MKGGLELVRRLAEIGERVARRDLAEAAAHLREAEDGARALEAGALGARREIAARLGRGAAAAEVGEMYRFVQAAERRAAEAEAVCDTLRARLARREAAWVETRRTARAVGAVCERRAQKTRRLRERREQQATDDRVNAWGGGAHAR